MSDEVVRPRSAEEIAQLVAAARRAGRSIVAGPRAPEQHPDALALGEHRDAGVLSLDVRARRAWVAPGTTLGDLRASLRPHGLTYDPRSTAAPATTLEQILEDGTCAGDVRHEPPTSRPIAEIDLVTARGYRTTVGSLSPDEFAKRRAAGGPEGDLYTALAAFRDAYGEEIAEHMPRATLGLTPAFRALLAKNGIDVANSLVGSGGALAVALRMHCRLEALPTFRAAIAIGFPDVYVAADNTAYIDVYKPQAMDGICTAERAERRWRSPLERCFPALPPGAAHLLVLFEGHDRQEVDQHAQSVVAAYATRDVAPPMTVTQPAGDLDLSSAACVPYLWYDMACPLEMLGHFLRDFNNLCDERAYPIALGGHFGRGIVHARVGFSERLAPDTHERLGFDRAVATSLARFHGAVAGESRRPEDRASLSDILFGTRIVAAVKAYGELWDPDGALLRRPLPPPDAAAPDDPIAGPEEPHAPASPHPPVRPLRDALIAMLILVLARTLARSRP